MRFAFLAFLFVLAGLNSAAAQDNPLDLPHLTEQPGITPPMPASLMEQRIRGSQVFYLGRYRQMDGWVAIRAGQPEFYYAPLGGDALVMGFLFDDKGNLITGQQLQALQTSQQAAMTALVGGGPTPEQQPQAAQNLAQNPAQNPVQIPAQVPSQVPAQAPAQIQAPAQQPASPALVGEVADTLAPASPGERLYAHMQHAPGLTWGNNDTPTFYVLFDPNCSHCRQFAVDIEPAVKAGRVAVRIVPVGVDSQSKYQAAFALAAADGLERLLRYAKGDTGALPIKEDVDVTGITANTQIITDWNLMATPIIVYRDARERKVRLIRGRPLDMEQAISSLTGR